MADAPRGAVASLQPRAEDVADLLKLLGNPQRLLIACLLAEGEFAVSQIEERLGIRQPSLSQQLGALREAGAIEGRREAKAVIYRLKDERLRQLIVALRQIFCPGQTAGLVARSPASPSLSTASPMAAAAMFARVGVRRSA